MSKIVLYIATSLDDFIARKNGSVDWLSPYENTGEDYGYKEFYETIGPIIMGNKTYQQFKDAEGFDEYYKNNIVYVFSRKNKGKNENYVFVNQDVKEFIKNLDAKNKDIWLLGGALIIEEFMKNNLVDEFIITIIPVLLGEGIPLFLGKDTEKKIELVDVKKYNKGVVQLYYKRKAT